MLETLRAEVVRCAQEAETQGLCRWRSGNFSARDEKTGLICMTPSGVDRRTMRAEDIAMIERMGAKSAENLITAVNASGVSETISFCEYDAQSYLAVSGSGVCALTDAAAVDQIIRMFKQLV